MTLTFGTQSITYDGFQFNYYPSTYNVFIYSQGDEPPFISKQFEVHNDEDAKPLIEFIQSAPIGNLVLGYVNNAFFISDDIKNAFSTIGSSLIYKYQYGTSFGGPLMMAGCKGMAIGTCQEIFTSSLVVELPLIVPIPTKYIDLGVKGAVPYFSMNGIQEKFNYQTGLNVIVFNSNLEIISFNTFNLTIVTTMVQDYWAFQRMMDYLDSVDPSSTVCILSNVWSYNNTNANLLKLDTYLSKNFSCKSFKTFLGNPYSSYMFVGQRGALPFLEYNSKSQNIVRFYPPVAGSNPVTISVTASSDNSVETGCRTRVSGMECTEINTYGFTMVLVDEITGSVINSYEIIIDNIVSLPNQLTIGDAIALIHNGLAPSTFVAIASATLSQPFTMNADLANAFKSLGATMANKITTATSYALIGRKGACPGSVPEILSKTGTVSLFSTFRVLNPIVKPFIEVQAVSKGYLDVGGVNSSYANFSINSIPVEFIFGRGFNLMTLDPKNGSILNIENFDTCYYSGESDRLATYLKSLVAGTIVCLAIMDDATNSLTTNLTDALRTVLNATQFQKVFRCSYSCIGVVGSTTSTIESYDTTKQTTVWQRFPMKSGYQNKPGVTYKSVKIDTGANIYVDGVSNGRTIQNFKIYSLQPNGQPTTNTNSATTMWDYISACNYGDIVIVSTTSALTLTNEIRNFLEMIGAIKIIHSNRQSSKRYCVIGRKGGGVGNALEYYNLDIVKSIGSVNVASSVAVAAEIPVFSTTALLPKSLKSLTSGLVDKYSFAFLLNQNPNSGFQIPDSYRIQPNRYGEEQGLYAEQNIRAKYYKGQSKQNKEHYTIRINCIYVGIAYFNREEQTLLWGTLNTRQIIPKVDNYLRTKYVSNDTHTYIFSTYQFIQSQNDTNPEFLPYWPLVSTGIAASSLQKKGDVNLFFYAGHTYPAANPIFKEYLFLAPNNTIQRVSSQDLQNTYVLDQGINFTPLLFTCFSGAHLTDSNNQIYNQGLQGRLIGISSADRNQVGNGGASTAFKNGFGTLALIPTYLGIQAHLRVFFSELDINGTAVSYTMNPQLVNTTNRDSSIPFLHQIADPDPDPIFAAVQLLNSSSRKILINPNEMEFKIAALFKSILDLNPSINIKQIDFKKVIQLLEIPTTTATTTSTITDLIAETSNYN